MIWSCQGTNCILLKEGMDSKLSWDERQESVAASGQMKRPVAWGSQSQACGLR